VVPGYEIRAELGRGGMGVVYRAFDPDLRREVAIKVLPRQPWGTPDLEQRFLAEAQLAGQFQHPGMAPVYEVGRLANGRPFFAMKLVQGRTLAALLRERCGTADRLTEWLAIFAQVCQAVAYAHSRGVIHRDLKPANIMVGAFGEVQVMDWGLAKVLGRTDEPATPAADAEGVVTVRTRWTEWSSQAGSVMGTIGFMAPEQARGEVETLDERCDVVGLGGILCVLLTGEALYRGSEEAQVGQAQRGELTDAHDRLDGCGADAELVALAKACLARAGRPATPRWGGGRGPDGVPGGRGGALAADRAEAGRSGRARRRGAEAAPPPPGPGAGGAGCLTPGALRRSSANLLMPTASDFLRRRRSPKPLPPLRESDPGRPRR
jgi:serine/threonine-protein kinase